MTLDRRVFIAMFRGIEVVPLLHQPLLLHVLPGARGATYVEQFYFLHVLVVNYFRNFCCSALVGLVLSASSICSATFLKPDAVTPSVLSSIVFGVFSFWIHELSPQLIHVHWSCGAGCRGRVVCDGVHLSGPFVIGVDFMKMPWKRTSVAVFPVVSVFRNMGFSQAVLLLFSCPASSACFLAF